MIEIEKVALSLEFWGSKWLLLEGPKGPGDCIFTVFSLGFSEALGVGQKLRLHPPGVLETSVWGARGETTERGA